MVNHKKRPQNNNRSNKSSKDIFIPVNNQKWKALRQLKKARIETGLYEEKRKKVEKPVKTNLQSVAEKESVSESSIIV